MTSSPTARLRLGGALLVLALCSGACASGPAGGGPGFLGDYSELRPGRGNESQLIYIDRDVSFAPYERVIIEPVTLWNADSEGFRGVDAEVQQWLAEALGQAFRENIEPDFALAECARPGTLRIRMAITAARGGWTDSEESFVGVVAVEVEVLDASSGKRLAAAVDTRGVDEREIREAFAEWASQARQRLAALRAFDRVHWHAQ